MKIIKNIRSSQEQEVVSIYPTETHVLVNKRDVTIDSMDGVATLQYEYDCVVVENAQMYADVVRVATEFYNSVRKTELLNTIVVTTTNGNTFDADDAGRASMNEAITASAILGITESMWKLADNTIKLIQLDELKEALALGIQAKGAIVLGQ